MRIHQVASVVLAVSLTANVAAQGEREGRDGKQGPANPKEPAAAVKESQPAAVQEGNRQEGTGQKGNVQEGNGQEAAAYIPLADEPARGGFYGGAEYLLWWLRKGNVPPLVTHGDPKDTPTGALGKPGTTVLFGGNRFGAADPFSGGRFTLGYWLGNEQAWGVEAGFFFLEQRRSFFAAAGTGGPGTGSLNVALFNGDARVEDTFPQVALEGTSQGNIGIRLTQRLWGTELNLRHPGREDDTSRLSWLAGFRFLDLEESFDLQTTSVALPPALGISTALADSIATRNRFYGAQIGADADFFHKNWRLTMRGRLALGGNDEAVKISGTTTNVDPIRGVVVAPGGYFSGPNNIGNHHHGEFAVVPEFGANLGYQISKNLTATVGYTFLYISDVVRAGDQIDRVVTFQTNNRPGVLFKQSDSWAQGINLGFQIRY
jgi:hypothetical protein